jgi:hypothetical protein
MDDLRPLVGGLGGSSEGLDQVDVDSFDKDIVEYLDSPDGKCGDFGWMLLCPLIRLSGGYFYVRHKILT